MDDINIVKRMVTACEKYAGLGEWNGHLKDQEVGR
jgi:hypothetical protein